MRYCLGYWDEFDAVEEIFEKQLGYCFRRGDGYALECIDHDFIGFFTGAGFFRATEYFTLSSFLSCGTAIVRCKGN